MVQRRNSKNGDERVIFLASIDFVEWMQRTAGRLGIESTLGRVGRPRRATTIICSIQRDTCRGSACAFKKRTRRN